MNAAPRRNHVSTEVRDDPAHDALSRLRGARLIDGAHTLLEDDLLRGRRAHDLRRIALVRGITIGAANVVQPEATASDAALPCRRRSS